MHHWKPFETRALITMLGAGMTQSRAARALGRTPKAVERKVWRIRQEILTSPIQDVIRFFQQGTLRA